MVGGDQHGVAVLVGGFQNGLQAVIHALHGVHHRLHDASVAHHVAVGVIAAQELKFLGSHVGNHFLGDLLRLHSGSLLEGDDIGGHFLVDFQILVHLAGAVTIPEVGDVTVLLGLGQGVLVDAGLAQHLGQGVGNDGGLHQIVLRDIQVAVVLQHTGKLHAGVVAPVELVKVLAVESQRDFLRPVAPEVKENHAVAVGNFRHRLAVPGDDESGQVLIDAADLGPVGFDSLPGGSEHPALTLHMGAPTLLHHGPVGFVTVHGDLHTAAAGGDGVVAAVGAQLGENLLQHFHILQRGGSGHVTAVQQNVAVGLLHTLGVGLPQQGDQVVDIGVDVAVGQQAQEVHSLPGQGIGNQILPGFRSVQSAIFDGLAHQFGALRVDLTTAQRVVTDLRIAHILIAGQADGGAVGFQVSMGAGFQQHIQRRSLCNRDRVAAAAVTLTNAVHNDQYNRFFHNV